MREFPFNEEKARNALIYLLKEFPGVSRVQVMKFFFLVDFYMYSVKETPVFGGVYVHMDRGPVPVEVKGLLSKLVEDGTVKEVKRKNSLRYYPADDAEVDVNVFSTEELDVIHKVIGILKSHRTAWNISKFTHSLSLWKLTKNGEPIPYEFATMSDDEIEEYLNSRRLFQELAKTLPDIQVEDKVWKDYEVSIPKELQREMLSLE